MSRKSIPDGAVHGTQLTYTSGCRCDLCKALLPHLNELSKAYRARKFAAMTADPLHPDHGSAVGYTVGCRCAGCKDAARWTRLFRAYKITREQYQDILSAQGGGCAICGRPSTEVGELCVDHDHSCCPGRFGCGSCNRGLLCTDCNHAIGKFQDDPDRLLAASVYLLKSRDVLGNLEGVAP